MKERNDINQIEKVLPLGGRREQYRVFYLGEQSPHTYSRREIVGTEVFDNILTFLGLSRVESIESSLTNLKGFRESRPLRNLPEYSLQAV